MGAWGPGHQANDTALDFLEVYKSSLKSLQNRNKIPKPLVSVLTGHDADESLGGDRRSNLGLLGLAEHILDLGHGDLLAPYLGNIFRAVGEELGPNRLDNWRCREERRTAVANLGLRLLGQTVDKASVEESNKGLLERALDWAEGGNAATHLDRAIAGAKKLRSEA